MTSPRLFPHYTYTTSTFKQMQIHALVLKKINKDTLTNIVCGVPISYKERVHHLVKSSIPISQPTKGIIILNENEI